jgi:hypothetical protein
MEWVKEDKTKKPRHSDGDIKVVKRFLFLPKRIGNLVRWLCFVKFEKQYWETEIKYHRTGGVFGGSCTTGGNTGWTDTRWIEN